MALKTFLTSKDSVVVLRNADSASFGAGKDYHIYVGNSGDFTIRGLVQFNLDFSDVTSITSATLNFTTARSNDGTVSGYARDTHGTFTSAAMHIRRLTSSFTEGTFGNDENFNGTNSVEWDNQPSTTTTNQVSFTSRASRPASPTIDTMDITAMVTDWFNGQTNHGIQIKYQSESGSRFTEYYSREGDASSISGAVAPFITLTYTTVTNPTATPTSPSGSVAKITNLSDTAEWTTTSETAMPELNWSYTNGGGGAQSAWRVRIYNNNTKTITHYDTGFVTDASHISDLTFSPVKNANQQAYVPGAGPGAAWSTIAGLVNGTKYFWTIQVKDASGNTSAESAVQEFNVRWGQAIYEFDAVSTSTSAWSVSHSQPPANTQAIVNYRAVASPGTTTGAWAADIGPLVGTQRYLQALLRMSTDNGTTKPFITDISLSFTSTAVPPDNWEATSGSVILDGDERRFGTKSALFRPSTTGVAVLQPVRATGQYDIPVLHNTRYTFSAFLKPGAIAGRTLTLKVFKSNGTTSSVTGLVEIPNVSGSIGSGNYNTFPEDNEGWYRLTYTFETDSGTDFVKPVIHLSGTGLSTDYLHVDGVQFEEGTVVRSWAPGFVTQSMTFEGAGLSIDASTGAKLRLRGATGGLRDVVEIGNEGLKFGGSTSPVNVYSGTASTLNVTGAVAATGAISTTNNISSSNAGGKTTLALTNAGSNTGLTIGGDNANLYRSAANTLRTDGSLTVSGAITGSGVTTDLIHGITLQRTTTLTVNTSTDASATAITWSSAVKNTSLYAYWSSGSAIAIPLTGWYSITCHLASGGSLGTGFAFRLYVLVNGTVVARNETQAQANTNNDTPAITTIQYLTAADSLVFRVSASSTAKTIGGSRISGCSVVYMGNMSA